MPLGLPYMGKHHLHMFHVGYMFVQGYIVFDVLSLWIRSPVDPLGNITYS